MDLSILDNIIIGRVDPHIYAFTTNTIPNYLKVGDTYRPVSVRLQEWRQFFPDLQKEYEHIAKVDNDTYFRDFAIHYFLEHEKRKTRLSHSDLPDGIYYSKEFFKETSAQDVIDAVDDILRDYEDNGGKYRFYNADTRLPETHTYERCETFDPRPNQNDTITRFKEAIAAGRTNLLMYAVMRFGKSFTAMCCATEMDADIVAVVSAIATVQDEWRKAVQSHVRFADYTFLTADNLASDEGVIRRIIDEGKKVVVFLTLQDLQGETIKDKHREVFGNTIDLLIVDETHFGARAEKYGQVLRASGYEKDAKNEKDIEDYVEASEADKHIKVLDARIKLHLSGTPYRILMGSEFSKEDIIAFYQFTDIVKDQEQWIKENNDNDEPEEEWKNPYFGFPQMIRFAFNPNESSRRRLKELRESGVSYAFSALLKPRSVKKSADGSHKRFVFEQEIMDLLEVIDGSKDDSELLGFLDYDRIKSGNMCRHIVMVLPYCASCDAMEELIRSNSEKFKNLNDYEIINISGVDKKNKYKSSDDIKSKIHQFESLGKKTITLTVNRMLTGNTVEEWDTMLFLKDTASPQEYDQAVFRLQNHYVKKYVDEDGNTVKYNMKPQTLLVDFMPGRMFSMQEQKSQIYNVNVDEAGNSRLEERISEELRISPIIVMNSDKMEQVQAADILRAVSEYSKTRGVAEESAEIPVDLSLLDVDAIRIAIERENELGSKQGFTTKAHNGEDEGTDLNTPGEPNGDQHTNGEDGHDTDTGTETGTRDHQDDQNKKDPEKQFRSYYARLLFFAFLTKDNIISLEDVISKISTDENQRIANHVGISKSVLEAIIANINKFVLRDLDYTIHRLNQLSHDDSLDPVERANVAIRKFGKLGESEVITPKKICDEMVGMIPDDGFTKAIANGHKILDIAGKAGEFALSVYERMLRLGIENAEITNAIYTIPTSGITYEFTRMIYEILGLDIGCIAEKFNAYDLLNVKDENGKNDYERITALLTQNKPINTITLDDTVAEGDEKVNFDIVVGNPPYQEKTIGDANGAQAKPIYQQYVSSAKKISSKYLSMITPARWYSGGWGLDDFRNEMIASNQLVSLHDFPMSLECFDSVEIKGGICYFMVDKDYSGKCSFVRHDGSSIYPSNRFLKEANCDVLIRFDELISIHRKVHSVEGDSFRPFSELVSGRSPFGLNTNHHGATEPFSECVPYLESGGLRYIARDRITKNHDAINQYKVYISKAYGAGEGWPHQIINRPIVGAPNTICSGTYLLVGPFETDEIARNVAGYMSTKLFRILVSINKISQDAYAKVYDDVPIIDFSKSWNDDELYERYDLAPDEIEFIESMIKPME